MRNLLQRFTILFAATVMAGGCGETHSSPTESPPVDVPESPPKTVPESPPPNVPIRVVGIRIAPDSIVLALGVETPLRAFLVSSDGSEAPASPSWYVFDLEGSVALDPRKGTVTGVRAGRALVEARYNAIIASAPVFVLPPIGTVASGALRVDEFWIEEFQYSSGPDARYYAPQVRVSATGEGGQLLSAVIRDAEHPWPLMTLKCNGSLLANQSVHLNGEVYGDWTLTFDLPGERLRADSATVEVHYLTPEGMLVTASARGAIRPGGGPGTYTGGENAGPCWNL